MQVWVQELLTGESATYSTVRYFCSWSASHPADCIKPAISQFQREGIYLTNLTFSFPILVKACRPRWLDMDAWFKYDVDAPMPSSAACSFRANSSIGTFRETGRTAIVFKFVLLWPRSDVLVPAFVVESTSSRTREAIIRRILEQTYERSNLSHQIRRTELSFEDF
jgi:hypothetical protein